MNADVGEKKKLPSLIGLYVTSLSGKLCTESVFPRHLTNT
jgi:hypothetical protein